MKLALYSTILATVGAVLLAEAAPTPQNVEGEALIRNFRLGYPAAHGREGPKLVRLTAITFGQSPRPRGGCRMRMKAIELSNWLREKTGFPLIEPEPEFKPLLRAKPDHDVVQILPHPMPHIVPMTIVHGGHAVTNNGNYVAAPFMPHREWRPSTFTGRLNKALVTLGPWEGRAVAFVLGCGIGSLLRMFWVLLVITFRSYRHDPVVEEIVIFEEVDDEPSPPPVYADEKVISAEEKQTSS